MILYLSRNETANLLDMAASEKSLHIRKLSGNFSLSEFIIQEMRKFASCRYFCVERLAITENDDEFLEALQSFQMMYDARIIVIHESVSDMDGLVRALVQLGVTDIVTASEIDEKLRQIDECLTSEGMLRYKLTAKKVERLDNRFYEPEQSYEPYEPYEEKETLAQSIIHKEVEDEYYRFDCVNVNIGIIGVTRRVGVTTIALGLVNFIKNHGGTACYIALNTNRHLESIASAYGFDTEEDYYTYDAIDFYECLLPKHDYNFIITDYGDIKQEALKKYRDSDLHLLCGAGSKRFEVLEFSEGLKSVKSVNPQILTYTPAPDCAQLFNTSVTSSPIIIKPVRNMLDFKTNGTVFKSIVDKYIVETSKRL